MAGETKFDPDIWHCPEGLQAIVRGNPWLDTFETLTPEYVITLEAEVAALREALREARLALDEVLYELTDAQLATKPKQQAVAALAAIDRVLNGEVT